MILSINQIVFMKLTLLLNLPLRRQIARYVFHRKPPSAAVEFQRLTMLPDFVLLRLAT